MHVPLSMAVLSRKRLWLHEHCTLAEVRQKDSSPREVHSSQVQRSHWQHSLQGKHASSRLHAMLALSSDSRPRYASHQCKNYLLPGSHQIRACICKGSEQNAEVTSDLELTMFCCHTCTLMQPEIYRKDDYAYA